MTTETSPLLSSMQQAIEEILDDAKAGVYGGDREDRQARRPTSAYDINCGLCEEWAERVAELYHHATGDDEVEVLDPGNLSGSPDDSLLGHVFIRFRGRFYDAECPEGVDDWRKLPLFAKEVLL